LETSRALARKYGVENPLSTILDFIPGAYPVASLPIPSRKPAPRKGSLDSIVSEKIVPTVAVKDGTITPPNVKEISPIVTSTLAERTPARSRVASSAIPTEKSPQRVSPVPIHVAQEQTPKRANDKPQQPKLQPLFSQNSFDEDETQSMFLHSIHSRRNVQETSPFDLNPGELFNYEFKEYPTIVHGSLKQRKKDILLHIFTQEDNGLGVAVLFEMLRREKPNIGFLVDLPLDNLNNTPLHWAASCARLNLCKILIARGASPSVTADDGITPIMRAVNSSTCYKERSFLQLLDMLQSSLLAKDVYNQTVLHHVALLSKYRSKRQIAQYYMQCLAKVIILSRFSKDIPYAAFVDSCDNNGESALHIAVRYRNHGLIHTLLTLGASKIVQNFQGESPFSLCGSDPRMRKLLVNMYTYIRIRYRRKSMMITLMRLLLP
jgi:ankyrin repeat protein